MENNNEYDAMRDEISDALRAEQPHTPQPTTPQPEKPVKEPPVKFDERQQRRVSELIKERQGHFAREARANEAAALARVKELELQLAAKGHENPLPVTEDVQRLSLRLAEKDAELNSMRATQQEAAILEELRAAAHEAKISFVDPVAFRLLRETTKVEQGKIQMTDTDETMSPISLQEHVRRFAATRPFLVRGQVSPGLGSTQATYERPSKESQLAEFFKPGNAAASNTYVRTHGLAAYKQLVAQAAEFGIMPGATKRRSK